MFTPYYFLAVGFGVFAVIVSVIGIKKPQSFPGGFYVPMMLIGAVIGIATLAMVWRGGEKEQEHRKHEAEQKAHEAGASVNPLPAGVVSSRS